MAMDSEMRSSLPLSTLLHWVPSTSFFFFFNTVRAFVFYMLVFRPEYTEPLLIHTHYTSEPLVPPQP
jgi:hypothetical protein